ncbi:MAG TPA: STAS domain-containing protein [Verrucomicrobiae bacterium]|nr:STAS domain-containing protein [Verrucomicrobiae bacterium]
MSTPSARILVKVGEKCACIRISGRANFTSSIDFKTLVNELLQKGYNYFVLDLRECTLMDSTFLGVLAGFGLRVTAPQPDQQTRTIELYNPNPRITDLLENLGVLHLFRLQQGEVCLPEPTTDHNHSPGAPSREEVTQTCLEAHRTLMDLSPENAARFKDVAAFLAEDLKKMKATAQ